MEQIERVVDEAEVRALATAWGEPVREHVELRIRPEFWDAWGTHWPGRRHAEVLFLLPRPGGLLLHRKARYPQGVWRLLTGGIKPGEAVLDGLAREVQEEVGLSLPLRRYVGLLTYELEGEEERYACASHILLMGYSDQPLQPSLDDEIEITRAVPLTALADVADRLERLERPWAEWGRFRAFAHRLALANLHPSELEP